MPTKSKKAKEALDAIIRKSRVHLYKPIQIAEILFRHRTEKGWNLKDVESYRNISKRWRDDVSMLLVGSRSTSSQKYQDNIFEANAMPPELLHCLGLLNKREGGLVEAYIYKAVENKLLSVRVVDKYIQSSAAENFSLQDLLNMFKTEPGLRRSTDKIYEILVYALFTTIVRALKVQITFEIKNKNENILKDFNYFIKTVLGVDSKEKITLPAALYRAGVANAADRGLDIWANFGLAVQVKHLTLTEELIEGVVNTITADKIVIVCLEAEKRIIETILKQIDFDQKLQGIITVSDLDNWYKVCLSEKYRKNLGANLLKDLGREFTAEFPLNKEIKPFLSRRGYDKITKTF